MNQVSTGDDAAACRAWQSLAQGLGFVNEHEEYWWSKLGPLAARMMNWARYSAPEQYRTLAFIYAYIIPACGPKPDDKGKLVWEVFLSYDCTPIQPSLNFHDGRITLRTSNVPISQISGTAEDPINQQASVDAMLRQQRALPSQDLRWFNHFVSKLFLDRDTAAAVKAKVSETEARQGVQCVLSHDFPQGQVQCKIAFSVFWKSVASGLDSKTIIWDAIEGLGDETAAYKPSLAMLDRYSSSENAATAKTLPAFFAIDSVLNDNYQSSRIKVYFVTSRTAFNVAVDIYTLGGLLTGPDIEGGIKALRVLWRAVLKVPEDWPDDEDLPANEFAAAVILNFEIVPGSELPAPKIYIPAYYCGS